MPHTNVTCPGADNGTYWTKITKSTAPVDLTITLEKVGTGLVGDPTTVPPGGATTAPFDTLGRYEWDSLEPGDYILTVIDNSSPTPCEQTHEFTISEPDSLFIDYEILEGKCGDVSSDVQVLVEGGTGPYKIQIENTADGYGPLTKQDGLFKGLPVSANPYTITVTDNNGCTETKDIIISSAGAIEIYVGHKDVTCCNEQTGEVSVVINGGTGPYRYILTSVSAGELVYSSDCDSKLSTCPEKDEDGNDVTTCPTNPCNTTYTFRNLPSGEYNLKVIDANGCEQMYTDSIEIESGDCITIDDIQATDITCNECCDGVVSLTNIDGGAAPYTIKLTSYPEGFNPPASIYLSGSGNAEFTNLIVGEYVVTIEDANGCTKEEVFGINSFNSIGLLV